MCLRTFGLPVVLALFLFGIGNGSCQSATHSAAPAHPAAPLDGVITLDGPWQFHPGDDIAWASPSFDDSSWEKIETGSTWEEQGHYGLRGFAWYRRHIVLRTGQGNDAALLFGRVEDAAEVYWNGTLVGVSGQVPPKPVWYITQLPQVYSLGTQNATGSGTQSGVLAIRVWKAPVVFLNRPYEGGLTRSPKVGGEAAIRALALAAQYRWLRSLLVTWAVALVSAAAGFVALLFWVRDRKRWLLLWVSLPMFRPAMELALFDIPGFSTFGFGYAIVGELVILTNICIWFSVIELLELRDSTLLLRWARTLGWAGFALTLVDTVMVWLDWTRLFPRVFLWLDVGSTIPVEAMELYSLMLVSAALRNWRVQKRHLDASRWLLAAAVVLWALVQAVGDWSALGARWTGQHIADWLLYTPMFTVWGSGLNFPAVLNVLLLLSILYAAWQYSQEQIRRQGALEQEFASARALQQVLVPEILPKVPGYSVTSAYRPAREVGGDFFQILPLEGESANATLVVLGDVSGKGLQAALAVSLIVGMLRGIARSSAGPAELLTRLNELATGSLRGGFATCIAVWLDSSGRCTIATAGHLAPFLNAREVQLGGSLPLGIVPDISYEEADLHIEPGDQLSLYTDGVPEARSAAGELYGFARLQALFQARPTASQAIHAAVTFGQDDDITVLTLTRDHAGPILGARQSATATVNV